MIRVLVVDDHRIFRQGMYALLLTCQDIEIVGEARDGREAITLTERLQPDVILMDIEMPEMDGFTATRRIVETTNCKVLILSMRMDEKDVRRGAECGAAGYLVKNCSREELTSAIRSVHAGQVVCSPEVATFFS